MMSITIEQIKEAFLTATDKDTVRLLCIIVEALMAEVERLKVEIKRLELLNQLLEESENLSTAEIERLKTKNATLRKNRRIQLGAKVRYEGREYEVTGGDAKGMLVNLTDPLNGYDRPTGVSWFDCEVLD